MPYDGWPHRKFHLFPLTEALGIGDTPAAKLLEWSSVRRGEFKREQRVGTLTERGIYIFQQRFTHAVTRCVVPLSRYAETSKHVPP